jgi:hypothetical protein
MQKEAYRLLILNEYESHLTYEFWEYAKSKDIFLIRLPPRSIIEYEDVFTIQALSYESGEYGNLHKRCEFKSSEFSNCISSI